MRADFVDVGGTRFNRRWKKLGVAIRLFAHVHSAGNGEGDESGGGGKKERSRILATFYICANLRPLKFGGGNVYR